MKMFKAWIGKIDEIEVERVTDIYAFLPDGRREKLTSDFTAIRPSFDAARDFLVNRYKREASKHFIHANYYEDQANIARNMKP